ncbi:peroxiredoxin family protein [Dactylosporangium sp. CA-152071]|uniref:peroxiredoxin family protein n=1 Tax=Dactylosporangium sp. CA-152071 TaxID=3239933 RepID=UPI003D927EDF
MVLRRLGASVIAALAVLVVAAGCADGASTGAAGPGSPSAPAPAVTAGASPATSGATAAPPTLSFTARTVGGGEFNGASLAGKPAVLWFWAPWCPTCAGQAKGVKATAEQLAGKVNVVGVGGLDDEPAMRRFITEWKLDAVPHLSDEAGTVWKKFGVTSQSTFVLLDSRGTVVHKGVLRGDDLPGRAAALT